MLLPSKRAVYMLLAASQRWSVRNVFGTEQYLLIYTDIPARILFYSKVAHDVEVRQHYKLTFRVYWT